MQLLADGFRTMTAVMKTLEQDGAFPRTLVTGSGTPTFERRNPANREDLVTVAPRCGEDDVVAACHSSASRAAVPGASSLGFHTTVFPHKSAGMMLRHGTETGKLPAVITATTPSGRRWVDSSLSPSSLCSVRPYSRRPSP